MNDGMLKLVRNTTKQAAVVEVTVVGHMSVERSRLLKIAVSYSAAQERTTNEYMVLNVFYGLL